MAQNFYGEERMVLLILLLGIWMALALLGLLFGFLKPQRFRSFFQGLFFVNLFILIPATLFLLWSESRPPDSLRAHDIVPHPSLQDRITFEASPNGTLVWVYNASAPGSAVLDFYRKLAERTPWRLQTDQTIQLRLLLDTRQLTVSVQDTAQGSIVTYLLRSRK